jgi:hypothetical protein
MVGYFTSALKSSIRNGYLSTRQTWNRFKLDRFVNIELSITLYSARVFPRTNTHAITTYYQQ